MLVLTTAKRVRRKIELLFKHRGEGASRKSTDKTLVSNSIITTKLVSKIDIDTKHTCHFVNINSCE